MEVTNNHLVGLDVFREILDAILIAMRNPDEIQMCSVESNGTDTLYDSVQEITLKKAEDAFQEDVLFLQTLLSGIAMFG